MKTFRVFIALVFGTFMTLQPGTTFADAQLGGLTCNSIPGTHKNLLIFSSSDIRCIFKGSGNAEQWYFGQTGIKLGLDLKFKGDETLHFLVISATSNFVPEGDFLSGKFRGGKATAALGIGVGAQVLLGGSNDTLALQPAVETSTGSVGASAGLGFLDIEPDPLNQARIVTPHGTLFTQTMYSGYFSHAFEHYHFTEPNYAGSDYYSRRAIAAASGQAPIPAVAKSSEAAAARQRLVKALTRYSLAEVDAARAQVAYDCWVYGMAHNHASEAGMCKAAFLEYVDKVETAVAEEKLEVLVMIPMQQRILFDTDVSDIDEHASPIFTSVVKRLGFLSSSKVHVTGHADKPGTPEYNQTLSEKRATTVTAGLIKAGVPAGLIVSDAFGSTDPIGSNPYDALNRRVDIVIEPLKANDEAIKQAVQQMKK